MLVRLPPTLRGRVRYRLLPRFSALPCRVDDDTFVYRFSLPLGEGGAQRRMRGRVSKFSRWIQRHFLVKYSRLVFSFPSELVWSFWVAFPSSVTAAPCHLPPGEGLCWAWCNCRGHNNPQGSAPKRGNRGTVTPLQCQPLKGNDTNGTRLSIIGNKGVLRTLVLS